MHEQTTPVNTSDLSETSLEIKLWGSILLVKLRTMVADSSLSLPGWRLGAEPVVPPGCVVRIASYLPPPSAARVGASRHPWHAAAAGACLQQCHPRAALLQPATLTSAYRWRCRWTHSSAHSQSAARSTNAAAACSPCCLSTASAAWTTQWPDWRPARMHWQAACMGRIVSQPAPTLWTDSSAESVCAGSEVGGRGEEALRPEPMSAPAVRVSRRAASRYTMVWSATRKQTINIKSSIFFSISWASFCF